ncbi:FtsQ-type POTRA domain-containing protein [Candidatus Aerophobetes bacterium]|nr:FtsQ-type POTRA domain-containing protein [Candidatus Aerophobetes bacterium]
MQKIPPQEIREEISLSPSTSIFTADLKKIYSAVKTHPRVKKAKIIKKFPSTLVVKIEERKIFAYIKEENFFLQIDRDGFIFGQTEKPLSSFAVIFGINPSTDREIIQKILEAIERCNFLNLKVEKASFKKDERGIVLFLEKDLKVILGLSPNYHYLSYLPAIFEDARKNREKFDTIDLRFDGQIVVFKEK